jgi:predicted nucleic acid-binding protein
VTILVDTDILIEVLRGRNDEILTRWRGLESNQAEILYTPVTAAEIWGGARPNEFGQLDDMLGALQCAGIDAEAGRKAGEYLRQFAKSHSLDVADALIAATAWVNGVAVWTRNRKHYPMRDIAFF